MSVTDLIWLAGLAAIVSGAAMIYAPAGLIAAGVLLAGSAAAAERRR